MKNKSIKDQLSKDQVSNDDLEITINANKDLFDKLNKLPEIEALGEIGEDKQTQSKKINKENIIFSLFEKLKDNYLKNDLCKYASWSIILMLFSSIF